MVDPSAVALCGAMATMFEAIILASCILQFAWAACTPGSGDGTCKTCGAAIGGVNYCSACNGATYAPVNGVCKDVSQSAPDKQLCPQNAGGRCTQCARDSFMYQGGCYQTGASNPGNTLCTAASAGKCTKAAEGYFVPPGATADKQSVISCSESTPVTLADGKQYKGVSNCLVCTAPTTTESTPNLAVCTTCTDGKYGSDCAGTCHLDCKTCAGGNTNDKCTSCKSTGKIYFKRGDGETGECVEKASCNGSYFPNDDVDGKKQCIPCGDSAHGGIDGCTTCTKESTTLKCSACTPATKKPNKAGTKCFDCQMDGCSHCSANGVCEACGNSKKVGPGGSSCVTNCPDNSTEKETGTCLCNEGYSPKDGSCELASTGSNLSTGAIAGISVAAVVVVGGLVGFLCWWFICRGKA